MKVLAGYKYDETFYDSGEVNSDLPLLFGNLPDLIIPEQAARILHKSVKTLYDWNYRGKTRKRKIPSNLFLKLGGGLYVRKDILRQWISSEVPPLTKE